MNTIGNLSGKTMNSTSAKTVDRDSFFKLHVWAFTLLAIAALAFGQPAQALIYTYDNTTTGAINFVNNANCNSGARS